jgi:hypothetical protein
MTDLQWNVPGEGQAIEIDELWREFENTKQ